MGTDSRARLRRRSDPASTYASYRSQREEPDSAVVEHGPRVGSSPFLAVSSTRHPTAASNTGTGTIGMRIQQSYGATKLDELRATPTYKAALGVVQHLLADPYSFIFARPVTELWSEQELPGYFDVVKQPMDLGTILQNLKRFDYTIVRQDGSLDFDDISFQTHVRLVFRNCMRYNDQQSEYYRHARRLLARADRRFTVRSDNPPPVKDASGASLSVQDSPNAPKTEPMDTIESIQMNDNVPTAKARARTIGATPHDTSTRHRRMGGRRSSTSAQQDRTGVATEADRFVEKAGTHAHNDDTKPTRGPWTSGSEDQVELSNIPEPITGPQSLGDHPSAASAAVALTPVSETHKGNTKWSNTSSVSSDEHEEASLEPVFAFASTTGMEKRRGRKSALVQDLETRHEHLLKRRKVILESASSLERLQTVEMTYEEKEALCHRVASLDFIQMKGVVDIVSRGMNRLDILGKVEVEMDIDDIDNKVLREVQAFLNHAALVAAHGTLRNVDEELAKVETQIVAHRYQKIA